MNSSTKIKAIIDTNVFISGVLFGGTPAKILTLWKKDAFIFCLSPELEAEIIDKLAHKFHARSEFIQEVRQNLQEKTEKYLPQTKVNILKDKDDNFLLELAEESGANFLVTGDKEQLRLKKYKFTKILSAKSFLKELRRT